MFICWFFNRKPQFSYSFAVVNIVAAFRLFFCVFLSILSNILDGFSQFFSNFDLFYQLPAQLDLDDDIEGEESLSDDENHNHVVEEIIEEEGPMDCLPESCYKKFPIFAGDDESPFWQGWGNLRLKTFRLIENKYFETAVITMILLSSMALVNRALSLLVSHPHVILTWFSVLFYRRLKMCIYRNGQFYKISSITWIVYLPLYFS